MFQILKADKMIDFMRWSKVAFVLSILMIGTAIFTLTTKSLNWGLDFTGGTLIEVGFEQPAHLPDIRSALEAEGFGDATVQNFGSARDVMVRLRPRDGVAGETLETKSFLLSRKAQVSKLKCVVSSSLVLT